MPAFDGKPIISSWKLYISEIYRIFKVEDLNRIIEWGRNFGNISIWFTLHLIHVKLIVINYPIINFIKFKS